MNNVEQAQLAVDNARDAHERATRDALKTAWAKSGTGRALEVAQEALNKAIEIHNRR